MFNGFIKFFIEGGPFMYILLAMFGFSLIIIIERFVFLYIIYSQKNLNKLFLEIKPVIKEQFTQIKFKNLLLVNYRSKIAVLQRRIEWLNLWGTTATLTGLLGTIFGLITAFSSVAAADASEKAKLLAIGISNALNTTAAGIMIALFSLIFYQIFNKRVELLVDFLDNAISMHYSDIDW